MSLAPLAGPGRAVTMVCVRGGGSWRIKHGEEEAPPSASFGWPAGSLASSQQCLPELLEWGTTTEIGTET